MNTYLLFFGVCFLITGGIFIYLPVTKNCNNETVPAKIDECNKSLDGSRAFMYAFASLCLLAGIPCVVFAFIPASKVNANKNTGAALTIRGTSQGGRRLSRR